MRDLLRIPYRSMEGGSVDELLDVTVECPVLDQLKARPSLDRAGVQCGAVQWHGDKIKNDGTHNRVGRMFLRLLAAGRMPQEFNPSVRRRPG
jgi:hypothetical protein